MHSQKPHIFIPTEEVDHGEITHPQKERMHRIIDVTLEGNAANARAMIQERIAGIKATGLISAHAGVGVGPTLAVFMESTNFSGMQPIINIVADVLKDFSVISTHFIDPQTDGKEEQHVAA